MCLRTFGGRISEGDLVYQIRFYSLLVFQFKKQCAVHWSQLDEIAFLEGVVILFVFANHVSSSYSLPMSNFWTKKNAGTQVARKAAYALLQKAAGFFRRPAQKGVKARIVPSFKDRMFSWS